MTDEMTENIAYVSADADYFISYPYETDDLMPDFLVLLDERSNVLYARASDVDAGQVISRCMDYMRNGGPGNETMAINVLKYALWSSGAAGYHRGYVDGRNSREE